MNTPPRKAWNAGDRMWGLNCTPRDTTRLICVHSTGAVNVALASYIGPDNFMAQAWKDDDFGFCTDTNAKASSASSVGGGEQVVAECGYYRT